jgi:hypothetical protein
VIPQNLDPGILAESLFEDKRTRAYCGGKALKTDTTYKQATR